MWYLVVVPKFQIVSYASKKFTIAMSRVLLRNVDINARKYDAGF